MRTLFALSCLALLVSACASAPPIDMSNVDTTLSPGQVVANAEAAQGRRVAWGGTIVTTRNLKDTTEIEVLGYPLDRSGRPDTGATAQHRFLVVRDGYLESADYRNGRTLTATGAVAGTEHGRVGEAPYIYPVLRAEELYLWPLTESRRRNPNVHFGIGVGVILR